MVNAAEFLDASTRGLLSFIQSKDPWLNEIAAFNETAPRARVESAVLLGLGSCRYRNGKVAALAEVMNVEMEISLTSCGATSLVKEQLNRRLSQVAERSRCFE